jgi:hypothetical protein
LREPHHRAIAARSKRADEAQAPRGLLAITAPVLLGQRVVAEFVTRFVAANAGIRCSVQLLDRRARGHSSMRPGASSRRCSTDQPAQGCSSALPTP